MRDLTSEVTVFVSTIGDEANFKDCLRHLDRQTVRFQREIISFVAPMSAAFNEMLKRCRTKYYVQVDEDMLLFPESIEKLIEELRRAPEHISHVAAPLWDCHLGRPLWGVKAYRHEILRRFPFKDTLSCEIQQLDELEEAGFQVLTLPLRWTRKECFGDHGRHFTPRTIFERWERIMQKRRALGRLHWVQPWPVRLLKRFARTGSELDLYAFLGAVSGIVRDLPPNREADFRSSNAEFERLHEYFGHGNAVKFAILEQREKLRESRQTWRRVWDSLLSKWRRRKATS